MRLCTHNAHTMHTQRTHNAHTKHTTHSNTHLTVIVKQQIFADAKRRLGGRDLDVLVVNAFGSTAQVGG